MNQTPPFREAVRFLMSFLKHEGLGTNLVWIFREDVIERFPKIGIREPIPSSNLDLVERYFEYGRKQGRGVTLEAFCRLGDRLVCYVWIPEDDEAASYAMQQPLNTKIRVPLTEAKSVRWVWWWRYLSNRFRSRRTWVDMIPLRSAVEQLTGNS